MRSRIDELLSEDLRNVADLGRNPPRGGYRLVHDSIMSREVLAALRDFSELVGRKVGYVLIGGLVVGVYSRPRFTQDIDVAVSDESDIEVLSNLLDSRFRRSRPHAFEHRVTGVEVEIVTAEQVKGDREVFDRAIQSAVIHELSGVEIPVLTLKSFIEFKLQRASLQDQADIESVVKAQGAVDVSDLKFTAEQQAVYNSIVDRLRASH